MFKYAVSRDEEDVWVSESDGFEACYLGRNLGSGILDVMMGYVLTGRHGSCKEKDVGKREAGRTLLR